MTRRTPFAVLQMPIGQRPVAMQSVAGRMYSAGHYPTTSKNDFAIILAAVQDMWGYAELDTCFGNEALKNRGDRESFPKEAWEETFTLLQLHQMMIPEPLY